MFKLKAALRGVGLSELIRQLLLEAPPIVADSGLRCMNCGADHFETIAIDRSCLTSNGVVTVKNFPAYRCKGCGETVTDLNVGVQVQAAVEGLEPGSVVDMGDLLSLEGLERVRTRRPLQPQN